MELPTCFVCFLEYDLTHRIPYVISCGHTFCSGCINKFRGKCPACQEIFSKVSKNYTLYTLIEEAIKKTKPKEVCQTHKEEINIYCMPCATLMCSDCKCSHSQSSKDVVSEEKLKDEVEKLLKSYLKIVEGRESLIKQIDNETEKQVKKEMNDTTKKIAEKKVDLKKKIDQMLSEAEKEMNEMTKETEKKIVDLRAKADASKKELKEPMYK